MFVLPILVLGVIFFFLGLCFVVPRQPLRCQLALEPLVLFYPLVDLFIMFLHLFINTEKNEPVFVSRPGLIITKVIIDEKVNNSNGP